MTEGSGPISVLVLGLRWPPETFVANVLGHVDPARVQLTVACPAGPAGDRPERWRSQMATEPSPLQAAAASAVMAGQLVRAPAGQRRLALSMLVDHHPVGVSREISTLGRWDVVYFPWTVGPAGFPHIEDLGAAIVVSCRGAQVNVAPLDPDRAGIGDDVRDAFSLATLVHCVSDDLVVAAEAFGLDRDRARVIRPAVDLERFAPGGARIEPSGRRAFELITTGTLYWRKGSEDLLVAMRQVVDAGVDMGLTIIGAGQEEARVRFTIADLGLDDRVRLSGQQTPEQVAARLRGADAFVLSSLSEGISNAVLEGMASGLPVVSTRAGGMAEAVTDGVEGRLVPIGDPEALAAALVAMANDPDRARAMGAQARLRVERDFDLSHQVEAYTGLFEEAARLGPRRPPRSASGATGLVPARFRPVVEEALDAVEIRRRRRPRLGPGRLVVLTFHTVADPDRFALLVDSLAGRVHPVSLDQVADAQAGGPPLPAGAVLLTFDDGHPSVLDHALPILRDRKVPAVVFVIAGLIGTDRPFWWDEVTQLVEAGARLPSGPVPVALDLVNALKRVPDAERLATLDELRATVPGRSPRARQLTVADLATLEAGGITIGSHTVTHPLLRQCDDAKVVTEVTRSREMLTEMLGHAPRSIAYPSGGVDDRVVAAVADAGYDIGFGWRHAVAYSPTPDHFRIPRIHTSAEASRGRFVMLAEGRHRTLVGTDRPGGG